MYNTAEFEVSEQAVTEVLEQQHNTAWRDPEFKLHIAVEGRDLTLPECYRREIKQSQEIFQEIKPIADQEIPPEKHILFVNMVESGIPGNPMLQYIDRNRLSQMYEAETGNPDTSQDFYGGNMRHCLGFVPGDNRFQTVSAFQGELPSDLSDCVGIVLSGSEANIKDDDDETHVAMKDKVVKLIHQAKDQGIPMFGICFGSQLLNSVFRAEVDWIKDSNDKQYEERGLVKMTKTSVGMQADSPLAGLPDEFYVHANHKQEVIKDSMPEELEILAQSDTSEVQIDRLKGSDTIIAVQNHVECGDTRADIADELEGVGIIPDRLFQGESCKARRVLFPHFLRAAGRFGKHL